MENHRMLGTEEAVVIRRVKTGHSSAAGSRMRSCGANGQGIECHAEDKRPQILSVYQREAIRQPAGFPRC